MRPSRRHAPRTARTVVFAVACVALAVAAHVAGHAPPPSWPVVAVAVAAVAVLAAPLAGTQRRLGTVSAVMVAAEAGLHSLFCLSPSLTLASITGQAVIRCPMPMPMSTTGSIAGSMSEPMTMPPSRSMPVAPWHGDHVMICAHLVAAMTTGWLLRRGDAAVCAALALLADASTLAVAALAGLSLWWRPRAAPLAGGPPATGRTRRRPAPRPRTIWLRHTVVLRGPPCTLGRHHAGLPAAAA